MWYNYFDSEGIMIEIKNLTKTYISKSKETVVAVNGLSLTLPSRGLVFLLGESGAGKSTLLNILGGVERADSGEVFVDGLDLQKCSNLELDKYRNTDVGFVFQEFNLLDNFNVAENVGLAQDLQNKERRENKVEEALTAVGMSSYAKRKINELSGGQKQRVAIARAIIKNPKIILADEPTGSLDAKIGRSILELLKEISKTSLVFVVSHDEVFANSFGDRIIRIADGEVIEDKTLGELAEDVKQDRQVGEVSQTNSMKRYSLAAKTAMKMATYSLGSKKIRLAITLILCIVCFAVFGIADTLASWNCEKTTYDAIMSSSDKYLVNWTTNGDEVGENYTKLYLRDRYGLSIKERYLPITDNETSYGCYNKYADGFIEIDDNKAKELGVELYAGRYPEKQGEIAISYHIYRSFKAGAYKTDEVYIDGSMLEPTDKENGILGKTVTLDYNYVFTIVGIIDSGYDYEKNSELDPLSNIYKGENSHGINEPDGHSMIFLPKGGIEYINTLMQTSPHPYGVPSFSQYSFEKAILNELGTIRGVKFVSDLVTFQKSGTKILWLGEEKENLADDEAIISYMGINGLLENMSYIPGISGNLGQGVSLTYVNIVSGKLSVVSENFNKIDRKFFKAYASAKIYEYAEQNASLYVDDENVAKIVEKYTDGDEDLSLAVAYFLSSKGISEEIESGYLKNPYGKSGLEIIAETNISLINKYDMASQFNQAIIRLEGGSELNVKIVGVYIPSEVTGVVRKEFSSSPGEYYIEEQNTALINSVAYEKDKATLEAKHLDAVVGLIRIIPDNEIKIRNAISDYLENHANGVWTVNKVLEQTGYIKSTMNLMKKIFYWVSLGLGIFASFMFGNYLINSIMARKKEIGILRAIGATSRDIFHICLFEGLILFAVIFSISSLISGIAGIVINSMVKSDLGIMISISVFGIRQVALIFAVSLAVTLVVSLIGSYVVSKRKPIDVIR